MILLKGKTDKGKEWIDKNIHSEDWQWLGDYMACESRLAFEITLNMVEEGIDIFKDVEVI